MPGRKSSATARKSFTEHWSALGDLICEAIYGGSGTAEPVVSIVDTKGVAIEHHKPSPHSGVLVGSMTTAMAAKLVASGKETYESLREKAAGGKCLNPTCNKKWATCDAKRGTPLTHTCKD